MFRKIAQFVKYNNALPLVFMVLFMGFSAAMASSPDVREALVSSEEVVRSVDNSVILAQNLSGFNFNLEIIDVAEDDDSYYVSYRYTTLAIVQYVWEPIRQTKKLVISKAVLANHYLKDLGLYVAKETSDIISAELVFLERTQLVERQKGPSFKIVSTVYDGLIGKRLNAKDQTFPGYAAVLASQKKAPVERELSPKEVQAQIKNILAARAKKQKEQEKEEQHKLLQQQKEIEAAQKAAAAKQKQEAAEAASKSVPDAVPQPVPQPPAEGRSDPAPMNPVPTPAPAPAPASETQSQDTTASSSSEEGVSIEPVLEAPVDIPAAVPPLEVTQPVVNEETVVEDVSASESLPVPEPTAPAVVVPVL